MRAVIFLAIVGVTLGSDNVGICEGLSDDEINKVWSVARIGATAIFGRSCPSFDIDVVAISGECAALAKQATCYGLKAEERYRVDVVNYGILAGDLENMKYLGNLACSDMAGCFGQIQSAIKTCMGENENFVQETIDAAELVYKRDFEAEVRAFADNNSGSILGDLASMALDQFSSADDIRTFIESQITNDVVEDAKAAGAGALEMAQNWCKNGCTDETAEFLKGIFGHMNGGGCVDASVFCGPCATRATEYFSDDDNMLPCCIENVVQKGIEAYKYVIKKYSAKLKKYKKALKASLSDEAVEEAIAVRETFVTQFKCVKHVYNTHKPDCSLA